MLRVAVVLGLLGVASCIPENAIVHDPQPTGPIAGIQPGQKGDDVVKVLGAPNARAAGWWVHTNRFDPNFVVWYYKERGRVVLDGYKSSTVVTSEADPDEDGRP